MTSAARVEANRENARQSTGPRSARGKARSRRNATRHGLAAGRVVLDGAERARLSRRLRHWSVSLRAVGEAEHAVVAEAVFASIVLDRIRRIDEQAFQEWRASAVTRFDRDHRAALEAAIGQLDVEPARAARVLRSSPIGCGWVADRLRQYLQHWMKMASGIGRRPSRYFGCWDVTRTPVIPTGSPSR